jgi:hypothetical protein
VLLQQPSHNLTVPCFTHTTRICVQVQDDVLSALLQQYTAHLPQSASSANGSSGSSGANGIAGKKMPRFAAAAAEEVSVFSNVTII